MKKTVILICPTVRNEVHFCLEKLGVSVDFYELKENNHNLPDRLRENLQTAILGLQEYDQIILTFGICGNATYGLVSPHAELVIPRMDDCISLLMGGVDNRLECLHGKFGIFLTAGWLQYEEGIWGELQYCLKKYGEKRATRIIRCMYEHLTYLTVLDTGAYDVNAILSQTTALAQTLGLEHRIEKADLDLLCELLLGGEDPGKFVHIPAGTPVDAYSLTLARTEKR